MAKRLIETTIWTQNKWFRKLKPQHKLLWVYLFCNCDSVGVWEEDLELASFIIGFEFTRPEIDEIFTEKIKWISDRKLWLIDFCNFQYGVLKEENLTNKPHQSYISLLKKHSLWIDYTKTMHSLKEKEKDTDKEKDKEIDKDKEKEKKVEKKQINIEFGNFWECYDKKNGNKLKLEKKWNSLSDQDRQNIMEYLPEYKISTPDKTYRKDPGTFLNNRSWNDEIISRHKTFGIIEKEQNYLTPTNF